MIDNPYASPPPSVAVARSRWWLVPAAIAGLFGVLTILGNGLILAAEIAAGSPAPWSDLPAGFIFWELMMRLVAALGGVLLVLAGWLFARGRGSHALLVCGLAFLVVFLNHPLNRALRTAFVGNTFVIREGGK